MRWLLTPSKVFSSRLTSSLPFTYTHAHTSSVPSLPPSLLFSGERQLDGMIHLQESSLRHVLLEFPGSRRSRVSNVEEWLEARGRKRRGSELSQCPPPAARCPSSSVLVPLFPQFVDRSRWCPLGDFEPSTRVHLLATPGQLQPLNPSSKCCGQNPTQPTRCPSRHRVLEGRETLRCPLVTTSALSPSPPRRCEFQHGTPRAGVACITSPKAGGEEETGGG